MSLPKFIDEIDRLFDELVYERWTQTRFRPPRRQRGEATSAEFEVPVPQDQHGGVTLSIDGRYLTVASRRAVLRQSARAGAGITASHQEQVQHSFELPADSEVQGFAARFDGPVLRVRVDLLRPKT